MTPSDIAFYLVCDTVWVSAFWLAAVIAILAYFGTR